jgi:hypothetical protein
VHLALARTVRGGSLERSPYTWNHVIEKQSLRFKELEHVLIEKVEQLFRDVLQEGIKPAFTMFEETDF